MSGLRLPMKVKKTLKKAGYQPQKRACPNCKQELGRKLSGHYVPASFGEEGFYICKKKE